MIRFFTSERSRMLHKYGLIPLAFLCIMMATAIVQAQAETITAQTVADLQQLYAFEGGCAAFGADDAVFATTHGLFDLETGEQIAAIPTATIEDPAYSPPVFSPDGQWLVSDEVIFEVETGDIVHQIEFPARQNWRFSDDGAYAHSNGSAFSLPEWEEIETMMLPDYEVFRKTPTVNDFFPGEAIRLGRSFKIGNGFPAYLSPQASYWVVVTGGLSDDIEQGIYDVNTGERLTLPAAFNDPFDAALLLEMGTFTANDEMFVTESLEGGTFVAYRMPSFEQAYTLPFDIGDGDRLFVQFSADGLYFGVPDDGIYDRSSGERLFEISGRAVFSPDSRWVATGEGLFALPDGQPGDQFDADPWGADFSADGGLVAVIPGGVFDLLAGGERFDLSSDVREVFFSADSTLLYGLSASDVMIYDTASGEVSTTLSGSGMLLSSSERYIALNVDGSCQIYGVGQDE